MSHFISWLVNIGESYVYQKSVQFILRHFISETRMVIFLIVILIFYHKFSCSNQVTNWKKFWKSIYDTPGEPPSLQNVLPDFVNQWWLFRISDSDLWLLRWQLQHSLFHYLYSTFRFSFFRLIVLPFCLSFSQRFKKYFKKHFWPYW